MRSIFTTGGKWHGPIVASCSLALILMAGLVDQAAGGRFTLALLYLVPVSVAAWYGDRWLGPAVAGASGIVWLVNSMQHQASDVYSAPFYWNAAQAIVLYTVAAALLGAMRHTLNRERETARTDHLTGAPNSRAFHERIEVEIAAQRRYRGPLTVAYLDVDNFKLINDRFGHSEGDSLLCAVAECIRKNIRATDFAARMGGDEFTLVLPNSGREAAQILARRLTSRLNDEMRRGGWPTTFSMGMITCSAPPASAEELVKAADLLMYQVKNRGKNSIRHEMFSAPNTRHLEDWDNREDQTA